MCICIREEGPKVGVSSGRGNRENCSYWAFTPGAICGLFSFIHQIFMWHLLCSGHYGECCGIKWPINLAECCNETPWQILREMALLNILPPGGQDQESPPTHFTKSFYPGYIYASWGPRSQNKKTQDSFYPSSLKGILLFHILYYFVF